MRLLPNDNTVYVFKGEDEMVKIIELKTIEDILPLYTQQEYREDLDRNRSWYLYRGMTNTKFDLTTSLDRNCKQHKAELETSILMNFTKYGALEDPTIERSVWRQMFMGQHYGLPKGSLTGHSLRWWRFILRHVRIILIKWMLTTA